MLRLGARPNMEGDTDSGHPTPREDENSAEESSESCQYSSSPLTSTPIPRRVRNISVRTFFEGSEKQAGIDPDDANVLVDSLKQLIHSTEKNRRLTKENERFLNESAAWYEERSFLERKVKESEDNANSLRNKLQEKEGRIYALEKQVAELLRSISEHPAEEASEAAVELVADRKVLLEQGTQCQADYEDVGTQSECTHEDYVTMEDRLRLLDAENEELRRKLSNLQSVVDEVASLRKEEQQWREKCSFLEVENNEVRKEEKELLTEIEGKKTELDVLKAKNESLTKEVDCLRTRAKDVEELRMRNNDLEQLQLENEKLLEEHKLQISELRSCVASYEQTIKSLRDSEKEMKKQIDDKFAEAEKLGDECRNLRNVGDKLSEESVFATLLNNELKLKLTQAYNEVDELRASLAKEQDARRAEVQSVCSVAEINKKLQQSTGRVDELCALNEKISSELDYLRQKLLNSVSKEEMEQLSASLTKCQQDLETAMRDRNALREKEEQHGKEMAKVDSLRFELKARDNMISHLRASENQLHCDLAAKCDELHKLQSQFDDLSHECCKIREEYHLFQENAEQQYCVMLEDKCQQIEALSARLAQLESYPGQTLSADGALCARCAEKNTKPVDDCADGHALYESLPRALREFVEKSDSNELRTAIEEMKNTYLPNHISRPECDRIKQNAATSTSDLEDTRDEAQPSVLSAKLDDSLPLSQVADCFEGLEDYRLHSESPDLRPELRRFFACIKYEQEVEAVKSAARHLLESCDRLFLDNAKEVFRKEVQNIHDCKDALEKMISSERMQWVVERENMELQLDRCRRHIEQIPIIQKEKAIITAELNATRVQIEQYRLKLRQKCEEVERLEAERDGIATLAKEFQKLDQDSQEQIKEANSVIDELERKLKDANAELERERREVIMLKDDNDACTLHIRNMKARNNELMQKAQELMSTCEKLEKTERYNQKTIQIVCESFWEREEFVQRLKRRSNERKKLIERFVEEVGHIIAKFGGSSDSVDEMHATVASWTSNDVQDDKDHELRKRNLLGQLEKHGSDQQFRAAQQQVLLRSK